ncbi:CSC1-like protein At4g02900 isoform X4 [Ananas comosus]|uniref:CSC1-like protein At4g02900 isoform X4 n=1 Tax=Ananas comosus TaxID=4615 RepID=A0A6P5EUL3_ANACO|nr:CSC1-like protein At4g02900 isoform X4 [Ananas comosus]
MGSLSDIGLAAGINILSALGFLLAFAILRLQPINDRVYFPKWYLKGIRNSPRHSGNVVSKFVNLDFRTYIRFLNWMPTALKMPEPELIDHAGLDSAVYIRIYLLGRLKIFVPLTVLGFCVLVPVNWTSKTLENAQEVTFSEIDKLSISNIGQDTQRFWAHVVMAYVFAFWTYFVLYKEYKLIASMRLHFLASEKRRPDQFTVLVRNVPPDPDESVSEHVEHFFSVNHQDHYLTHQVVYNANKLASIVEKKKGLQNWLVYYENKHTRNPARRPTMKTGFWGLWGKTLDAIDYHTAEIEKLSKEEDAERERVISNPKSIMPAAFVSFKSRWGAAVCAQTQQSSNPTLWLTEWAPEPRDVYWSNLAIPYVELTIRRSLMAVALFFLTFFFIIPIAFVQSLANLEGIEKVVPFLRPVIEVQVVKSLIQGFLPGIALKVFLILLPTILMTMSKIEGFTALSALERRIPEIVGRSIPMKATFFISYIMVDGWAGIAAEIIRLKPLVIFHLKNTFLVKTEQDREQAMDPGCLEFASSEPRIQLYFLLGLVYAVVTPILLPFIIVFFSFSFLVFRHQIINVYNQQYESGASFWPDVHGRLIVAMIVSQLLLMGLMSTQRAPQSTLLLGLPVITICFHSFCKGRFEPAFVKLPLQDAMVKDTLERATEPNLNLRDYLKYAYIHPVFHSDDIEHPLAIEEEERNPLVATKRNRSTPGDSKYASETSSDINF